MMTEKHIVLVRCQSLGGTEAKQRFEELANGWMSNLVGVEQIRLLVHSTNNRQTLCFIAFTFPSKEAYQQLLTDRVWAPSVITPLRNDPKLRFAGSMPEEATTDPEGYRVFHAIPEVLPA